MSAIIKVRIDKQEQRYDLGNCDKATLRMLNGHLHSEIASVKARLAQGTSSLAWEAGACKALVHLEHEVKLVEAEQERRQRRATEEKLRQEHEARRRDVRYAFFDLAQEMLPKPLLAQVLAKAQARAAKGGA